MTQSNSSNLNCANPMPLCGLVYGVKPTNHVSDQGGEQSRTWFKSETAFQPDGMHSDIVV
jgi:hypothetical protein